MNDQLISLDCTVEGSDVQETVIFYPPKKRSLINQIHVENE